MTAQNHENLIIDGKQRSMTFCPGFPEDHPKIMRVASENIKTDEKENFCVFSTGCWRRYIGTWEIKDGRLFLIKLCGLYKIKDNEPIFADWFSGVLRIPQGQMLHYVHMGFASVYEEELHIKIEKGMVVKSRVIDNRKKQVNFRELGWNNLPGDF